MITRKLFVLVASLCCVAVSCGGSSESLEATVDAQKTIIAEFATGTPIAEANDTSEGQAANQAADIAQSARLAIERIKTFRSTFTNQTESESGANMYSVDWLVALPNEFHWMFNSGASESIQADGKNCLRVSGGLWECSGEMQNSAESFTQEWISLMEGRLTRQAEDEGYQIVDYGYREGALEEQDCHIFYREESLLSNSSGQQDTISTELCIDPLSYYPVLWVSRHTTTINGEVTSNSLSTSRSYDFNVPLEITLPTQTADVGSPYQATVAPDQPNVDSPCEIAKWSVIPTKVESTPGSQGFKDVLVTFAVKNGSPYWGIIRTERELGRSFITTEGGFQYSATRLSRDVLATMSLIPPGFAVSCVEDLYMTMCQDLWQYKYTVAESQNHFLVTFPIKVFCHTPDFVPGQSFRPSETNTILLDLDKDVQTVSYPTEYPDSEFASITEPVVLADKGTVVFQDVHREENGTIIVMRFTFTNASEGYATSGDISASYLIGDNGVIYKSCISNWSCPSELYNGNNGQFSVGPAQSGEFGIAFPVEANVKKLKLALTEGERTVSGIPIRVNDLPDE